MRNEEFINIAKHYGYSIDEDTIEGVLFDEEDLPLGESEIRKELPESILALYGEVKDSCNVFSIYMDADTKTLESIFAIQSLNTKTNKYILWDLAHMDFYDPIYVPDKEGK